MVIMSNRQKDASKCRGKWPDQTLPEVPVAVTPRVCLARGPKKTRAFDAGLEFIWRLSMFVFVSERHGPAQAVSHTKKAFQDILTSGDL